MSHSDFSLICLEDIPPADGDVVCDASKPKVRLFLHKPWTKPLFTKGDL